MHEFYSGLRLHDIDNHHEAMLRVNDSISKCLIFPFIDDFLIGRYELKSNFLFMQKLSFVIICCCLLSTFVFGNFGAQRELEYIIVFSPILVWPWSIYLRKKIMHGLGARKEDVKIVLAHWANNIGSYRDHYDHNISFYDLSVMSCSINDFIDGKKINSGLLLQSLITLSHDIEMASIAFGILKKEGAEFDRLENYKQPRDISHG